VRLVLSAGEASGDQIGADLAAALKRADPAIELAGLAGPDMVQAGVERWYGLDQLNVMGLTEVLTHLPRLVRFRRQFAQRILQWQPDAFIGIDAPDFNLGLARRLRKKNLVSMHYVSPSVWAWRSHRIPRIARSLDLLLTLFPFEPALYQPHGLDTRFVGHHLADRLVNEPPAAQARHALNLAPDTEVIALLPGSRGGELDRHAELLAETAVALRRQRPAAELVVLLAEPEHEHRLREPGGDLWDKAGVRFVAGRTRTGLRAADVAVAASGTVTLEAFLLGCPLVVYYRLAPATYWLARSLKLVKSQHVSLPNILTRSELVPECLQNQATPERLVRETLAWLNRPDRVEGYRQAAADCASELAIGAGEQAAAAILQRLRQ